ncbi:MAG: antitoxin VbhA family protein [Saprospiraceae bacterium]|nr:antitoxin VbhA family protein [Saprospiraceae bacterium]
MESFDEYLRQGEPNKAEKAKVWKTAIGLQQVDGLKPSEYLIETAKQNIDGDITIDEVKKRIDSSSIAEINRQLYNKYQLSTDEVSFIESMIKPMG